MWVKINFIEEALLHLSSLASLCRRKILRLVTENCLKKNVFLSLVIVYRHLGHSCIYELGKHGIRQHREIGWIGRKRKRWPCWTWKGKAHVCGVYKLCMLLIVPSPTDGLQREKVIRRLDNSWIVLLFNSDPTSGFSCFSYNHHCLMGKPWSFLISILDAS